MSLTLDYPYNQKLAKKLSHYQYMWEPMQTNTFIRSRSGGAMYAQPGSSATYPMLDMVSQRIYDRGRPSKGEALMKVRPMRPIAPATGKKRGGAKAKKLTNKQLAYEIALALNNEMTGGSINWDQVKNVATPYLKQGVSMGLNIAVPTLSKAIGEFIAGAEGKMIGAVVGELARDLIKTKTGLARQKNGGKISLSKLKKKTKPYVSAGLDAVVPGVGGLLGSVVEPGAGTVVGTLAGQLAREGIRSQTGYGRSGGKINLSKLKKKMKPYVSAGLDAVVPGVGGLLGSVVEPGAGTVVGTLAGQLAREGICQQTGYGRNRDVGVYKGGAKARAKPKPKPKANSGGRKRRNEIVKKVMKEKGLSLPQASRYVKQNNLY